MLMIALTFGWYGIYGVLFDQLRKAYKKALQLTTEFRKKTTFLMFTSDYLTVDDNKGFSFDIENNIEIWWRMREHIYFAIVNHSQFHNATMEGFIVIIVLNAVVLLTMSFMKAADIHPAVYVYLFSLEALLTATIIKHLRSSVRINKNFHHHTLRDLRTILFNQERQLNQLVFAFEMSPPSPTSSAAAALALKRRLVSNLSSVIRHIEGNPKLPGRIAGIEIKRELLIKGVLGIAASCASAILRLGIE